MRSLSSALNTAYGNAVIRPVWLVRVDLTSPIYLSSSATVTWASQTWTAADVNVTALRVGAMKIAGTLTFGNADDVYGTIALTEGFTDKRIRIYGYDGSIAAPVLADVVQVCDAVGSGCEVGDDVVRVTLRDSTEYKVGPRAIVSPAYGFTKFMPAGRVLTINGQSYVVERRR